MQNFSTWRERALADGLDAVEEEEDYDSACSQADGAEDAEALLGNQPSDSDSELDDLGPRRRRVVAVETEDEEDYEEESEEELEPRGCEKHSRCVLGPNHEGGCDIVHPDPETDDGEEQLEVGAFYHHARLEQKHGDQVAVLRYVRREMTDGGTHVFASPWAADDPNDTEFKMIKLDASGVKELQVVDDFASFWSRKGLPVSFVDVLGRYCTYEPRSQKSIVDSILGGDSDDEFMTDAALDEKCTTSVGAQGREVCCLSAAFFV